MCASAQKNSLAVSIRFRCYDLDSTLQGDTCTNTVVNIHSTDTGIVYCEIVISFALCRQAFWQVFGLLRFLLGRPEPLAKTFGPVPKPTDSKDGTQRPAPGICCPLHH